jgi:cell division protein YceG involved in septum cleavage
MSIDNENFISQAIPPHKHRTLHILLSILAIVVVVGSVFAYNYKMSQRSMEDYERSKSTVNAPSDEELKNVADRLNENKATSTPVKPEELKKIVDRLNKQGADQKPPTDAELKDIIDRLNN